MYEVGIFTEGKGWQSWYVNGIWDAETYEVLADLCGEED